MEVRPPVTALSSVFNVWIPLLMLVRPPRNASMFFMFSLERLFASSSDIVFIPAKIAPLPLFKEVTPSETLVTPPFKSELLPFNVSAPAFSVPTPCVYALIPVWRLVLPSSKATVPSFKVSIPS